LQWTCHGRLDIGRIEVPTIVRARPRSSALWPPRLSEHRPLRASPRIASDHDDVRSASDGGVDPRRGTRDDLVASRITISARKAAESLAA
jgi:hypothetical protein